MKKFFKRFVLFILILGIIYLVIGLFAPSSYKVERIKVIDAPAEIIFKRVAHLQSWNSWSPWARMDSTAVFSYSGTDGAVGSIMNWKGDPEKTGEGSIEIIELVANEKMRYKLTFNDWGMTSTGDFTFTAEGTGTKVSWTNEGEIPYLMRTISWIMYDMDKMMGPDFEKGLEYLSEQALHDKLNTPSYTITEVEFGDVAYIGIHYDTLISAVDSVLFGASYSKLGEFFAINQIEMMGVPVCITYKWDEPSGRCELMPAFPVRSDTKLNDNTFKMVHFDHPKALVLDYYGNYMDIWKAHQFFDGYIKEHNLKTNTCIEEYITDPTTVPSYDDVLTKVYYIIE